MTELTTALIEDEVFDVLASSRRREALKVLAEGPANIRTLATALAAAEHDVEPDAIEYDQRQTVHVSLQQSHLPKLAELDVIVWDRESQTVAPGPEFQPVYEVLRAAPNLTPAVDD